MEPLGAWVNRGERLLTKKLKFPGLMDEIAAGNCVCSSARRSVVNALFEMLLPDATRASTSWPTSKSAVVAKVTPVGKTNKPLLMTNDVVFPIVTVTGVPGGRLATGGTVLCTTI